MREKTQKKERKTRLPCKKKRKEKCVESAELCENNDKKTGSFGFCVKRQESDGFLLLTLYAKRAIMKAYESRRKKDVLFGGVRRRCVCDRVCRARFAVCFGVRRYCSRCGDMTENA